LPRSYLAYLLGRQGQSAKEILGRQRQSVEKTNVLLAGQRLIDGFLAYLPYREGSLSGKFLANIGHSSYKCRSLAEPPETSAAANFVLEGASESDFA